MSAPTPFFWLGRVDVAPDASDEVRRLGSQPKRLALLAWLALARPRGPQRRDLLLALLWPELDIARGRNALSQTLHQLRRALGSESIVGEGADSLALDASGVAIDALAFEAHATAGRWREALDLYAGPLLPGLHVGGVPDFERWLDDERARLAALALRAAMAAATEAEAVGNLPAAIDAARRACTIAPDDESTIRRLMQLLAASGDRVGALRAYESFARRLRLELETEPSGETTALATAIRREAGLAVEPPAGEAAAPPRDGVHAESRTPTPTVAPVVPAVALAPVRPGARSSWVVGIGAGVLAFMALGATLALRTRRPPTDAWTPRAAVAEFGADAPAADSLRVRLVRRLLEAAVDEARLPTDAPDLRIGGTLAHEGASLVLRVVPEGSAINDSPIVGRGPADSLLALAGAAREELVARLGNRRLMPTGDPWFNPHRTDALDAVLQGEALMRSGQYQLAASAFARAVALDTGFIAAWFDLAVATEWAGQGIWYQASDSALQQAQRSPRALDSHGDLAAGVYHYLRRDARLAAARLGEATVRHPSDPDVWYWAGEVAFHYGPDRGRELGDSRPAFERVVRLDPARADARLHLARLAAREGRREEAREQLRRLEALQPAGDRAGEVRALLAWIDDDQPRLDSIAAQLSTVSWPVGNAAAIGLYDWTADPVAADRLAAGVVTASHGGVFWQRARVLHALLLVASGRPAAAEGVIAELDPTGGPIASYLRALSLSDPHAGTAADRRALDATLRRLRAGTSERWGPEVLVGGRTSDLDWQRVALAAVDADAARLRDALRDLEALAAAGSHPAVNELVAGARLAAAHARGDTAATSLALPDFEQPATVELSFGMRSQLCVIAARTEEARGHLDRAHALYQAAVTGRGSLVPALLGSARVERRLGRPDDARRDLAQLVRALRAAEPPFAPARAEAMRALAAAR